MEDEFDMELPDVMQESPRQYSVSGLLSIEELNRRFNLDVKEFEVETLSGLLMALSDKLPQVGDSFKIADATAEVLEVRGSRAVRVRLMLAGPVEKAD